jgi:UDP-glucose 4-epimerase
MMTRYLITGAAGFLGYYIASQLADEAGSEVFCIDNFIRGESDTLYDALVSRANVTHLTIDLNEQAAVRKIPTDFDVVFHMAALNGTQNFYNRPFDVLRCCTLPTINLIEHLAPSGFLKRFIYAGTSEAYASTVTRFNWPVPTSEDVPLCFDDVFNPRWSYGASKMHGEVATVSGCRHFSVPFTIVRFHNAYGPRMGDKHVIPDFLMRAKKGRYELFGHEDTRSFIYADDAARATITLGATAAADGQVVNVGGEQEIMIGDLGRMMMTAAALEGEIKLHPSPAGSVKRRAPALDKLRALTNYRADVDLTEGLRRTADFYLNSAG